MPTISGLEHPALIYDTIDGFLGSMVPYVVDGVERGEPVFAAVGREEVVALRSRLGELPSVRIEDAASWHPVPATRLRAFHAFVTEEVAAGASRIRLAGEPAWGAVARPEFVREWARYESILNTVLAPYPVSLVCTYPSFRLDPGIVRDARRTHPLLGLGGSEPSASFEAPDVLVSLWAHRVDPVPVDAPSAVVGDPARARWFATEQAGRLGLTSDRIPDLQVAVAEVATNAIVHAGGQATIAVWRDADFVVCQVEDDGPGVPDPLTGYRPPTAGQGAGRGLWLARQVVDLLQIAPTATGTAVRLSLRLAR